MLLLQTVVLKVGMSCEGCVGAVKRVLGKMEGLLLFRSKTFLFNIVYFVSGILTSIYPNVEAWKSLS